MSLDKYIDKDEILETNKPVHGNIFSEEDIDLLTFENVNAQNPDLSGNGILELHVYTTDGTYMTGIPEVSQEFLAPRGSTAEGNISLKLYEALGSLNITRGHYEIAINFHENLVGDNDDAYLYIDEIDPDKRELKLVSVSQDDFEAEVLNFQNVDPIANNLIVNFGFNSTCRIINHRVEDGAIYIRSYKELPEGVAVKQRVYIARELMDSWHDTIYIKAKPDELEFNQLKGANFDLEMGYGTNTATDFQNWSQLLDASTNTAQEIVDSYFSGSLSGINLPIDFTAFDNFVFYSSAVERIKNFKYKLQLIEHYDDQIDIIGEMSGSDSGSLQGNINTYTGRKNNVIGGFDAFERWLYNEPTSSLYTHGVTGSLAGGAKYSLTPWPKFLSGSFEIEGGNNYRVHHVTHSLSQAWYDGFILSASIYDSENLNSLVKTIPEHIRLDENNSQYDLFVNMIGHHFDILHTYIKALTDKYSKQEHPKSGIPTELLPNIAKSMGWSLTNGKQAEQLWQYRLGKSSTGAYQSTGSMFSKSSEDITSEVWRRIVNNLPYLLKTKGTSRAIKALMNTYGIPQTLLSIREYGGPKVEANGPDLIEDRFSYALQFNQAAEITFPRTSYSSSIAFDPGWGIANAPWIKTGYRGVGEDASIAEERPADTVQFRFKPAITASMQLWELNNGSSKNAPAFVVGIQHTGSLSGSSQYGRVYLQIFTDYDSGGIHGMSPLTSSYDQPADSTHFSEYVPLYDGDFWNLQISTEFPFVTSSFGGDTHPNHIPTFSVRCQRAADYIHGKIVHSASIDVFPGSGSSAARAIVLQDAWAAKDDSNYVFLGGNNTTPGATYPDRIGAQFSGSMQEYREWLEIIDEPTFDQHTLNPTSYVSSLSPSSSFDTLVRHYPLGTELKAIDHSAAPGLFLTSSHPYIDVQDFSPPFPDGTDVGQYATMSNFPTPDATAGAVQKGNYERVEERYYIDVPSLGGSIPRSTKIRFDDNALVSRLSPTNTAEMSRFDKMPLDSNRLGLFYSPADQINKDIYNQVGGAVLDDLVGDPDDEFQPVYKDLREFSEDYWKKYSNPNDINEFIRLFSIYDFSLFQQIKQTLPARAHTAMGLLVEPHALERSKVQLTKPIRYENPQYEDVITNPFGGLILSHSMEIQPLSMSLSTVFSMSNATSIYHTPGGNPSDWHKEGNYLMAVTASLPRFDNPSKYQIGRFVHWYEGGGYRNYQTYPEVFRTHKDIFKRTSPNDIGSGFTEERLDDKNAGDIGARWLTQSLHEGGIIDQETSPTGSIIYDQRKSYLFSKVIFHYSSSGKFPREDNTFHRSFEHAVSKSLGLFYSRSLEPADYMDDFFIEDERLKYEGTRLTGPAVNLLGSNNEPNNTPVVQIFETNPNQMIYTKDSARGNIKIR